MFILLCIKEYLFSEWRSVALFPRFEDKTGSDALLAAIVKVGISRAVSRKVAELPLRTEMVLESSCIF